MKVPVVMPQLGLTMTEGSVAKWLKEPGEHVAKGEMLFVVSTEKADMEVESLVAGELTQIVVEPGQEVAVGTVIAYIEHAGSVDAVAPTQPATPSNQPGATTSAKPETSSSVSREERIGSTSTPGEGLPASPRARRLAKELGIDIALVTPGSPKGRVVEEDVRRFATSSSEATARNTTPLKIVITDTTFGDIEIESGVLAF